VLLQGNAQGGKVEETEATMERPADWFATACAQALKRAGIAVEGKDVGVRWPSGPPPEP